MKNTKEKRNIFMRLYNILYVCKIYYTKIINIKWKEIDAYNVKILGWKEGKEALEVLSKIECLNARTNSVYEVLSGYERYIDDLNLSIPKKEIFFKRLDELIASVETLLKIEKSLEMGNIESGIDIKIPRCESLKEYMGYLKDIDFIFTQCPYLIHEKERIKFNSVDVGSQWLAFAITGAAGGFYILNNLAKLVQKTIQIKSNLLVCKQQELMLEEYKRKGEIADEVIDVFKKMKNDVINKSVIDLEDEIEELKDGEERDKVKRSIEILAELMEKGVEIYSSIETPKEIKVMFPFEKDTVVLPDNILKYLEDKNKEEQ